MKLWITNLDSSLWPDGKTGARLLLSKWSCLDMVDRQYFPGTVLRLVPRKNRELFPFSRIALKKPFDFNSVIALESAILLWQSKITRALQIVVPFTMTNLKRVFNVVIGKSPFKYTHLIQCGRRIFTCTETACNRSSRQMEWRCACSLRHRPSQDAVVPQELGLDWQALRNGILNSRLNSFIVPRFSLWCWLERLKSIKDFVRSRSRFSRDLVLQNEPWLHLHLGTYTHITRSPVLDRRLSAFLKSWANLSFPKAGLAPKRNSARGI